MKYIVANLKSSLNDNNIDEYISIINKISYSNLIICPSKKYINSFDKKIKIGTQDYYDDIKKDYCIIGHYEKKNTSEEINNKVKNALNNNINVFLCVGNYDYNDIDALKKELDLYLKDIDDFSKISIAYEPYFMINTNKKIDYNKVNKCIIFIKKYFNNKVKVFYGGNVNDKSIDEILKICDGIFLGRASFDPYNLTNMVNKIRKNI